MQKKYEVKIEKQESFPRKTTFFCIGSCFSAELGTRLQRNGLRALVNPFGTIYNAASLYSALDIGVHFSESVLSTTMVENGFHFSPYFSKEFGGSSAETLKLNMMKAVKRAERFLKTNPVFVMTLGTSAVYEYNHTIVSNCHGLPHRFFKKRMLDAAANFDYIKKTIDLIKNHNPNSKIILTLSPVRHTPDNAVENSLSKANLRSALGEIMALKFPNVHYFPAYEIVLDEFRDYSFFKKDSVHIKNDAVNTIVARFIQAYFSPAVIVDLDDLQKIKKMLMHVPSDPTANTYFSLLKKISENIAILEKEPIYLNLFYLKTKLILPLITYFYSNQDTDLVIKSLFPDHLQNKYYKKIREFIVNCLLLQKNLPCQNLVILNNSFKNVNLTKLQNLAIKKMALRFHPS